MCACMCVCHSCVNSFIMNTLPDYDRTMITLNTLQIVLLYAQFDVCNSDTPLYSAVWNGRVVFSDYLQPIDYLPDKLQS